MQEEEEEEKKEETYLNLVLKPYVIPKTLLRLAFSLSNQNANQYQNGNEALRAPYQMR
jgi:hypothetical protein